MVEYFYHTALGKAVLNIEGKPLKHLGKFKTEAQARQACDAQFGTLAADCAQYTALLERRHKMATALNNRTLASIVAEFFGEDETKNVVYCDAGNGCGFGEDGQVIEYDAEKMSDLIMIDIPEGEDRTSADGFESMTQSEWQEGENGYRWRVRF